MSYNQIADYFISLGYRCTNRTASANCKKLDASLYLRVDQSKENNPFFGRKHSSETRDKISAIRIEKGYARGSNNYFYGKSGDKSPAWKGGKSKRQAIFYASKEWYDKRLEIFHRDNFTCMECGLRNSKTRNTFNVHHIIPLSVDWELRLNSDNLITLCEDCHRKTFNQETKFITYFQDIVRSSQRCEELDRNDLVQKVISE